MPADAPETWVQVLQWDRTQSYPDYRRPRRPAGCLPKQQVQGLQWDRTQFYPDRRRPSETFPDYRIESAYRTNTEKSPGSPGSPARTIKRANIDDERGRERPAAEASKSTPARYWAGGTLGRRQARENGEHHERSDHPN